MLAGGMAEVVNDWYTIKESPSSPSSSLVHHQRLAVNSADIKPLSHANLKPSSIALASVSRGPNSAPIFMLKAAQTDPR